MSKYIDKNIGKGSLNIGNKTILSNIGEELKNKIFANINSVSFPILYDLITPEVKLSFVDKDNNSVTHILLNVNNRTIPENTKLELLKYFIKRGAPINSYNKMKMTPLHLAIENGHHLIVKYLLANGANPNAETMNNLTALQLALNATPIGCKTDIIPKELYPDQKKNKNILTEAINKFAIDNYDVKYNKYFEKVFDDYLVDFENFNENKEILENIKKELMKLYNSDSPENEIKNEITEKKKGYIKNIADKFLVDSNEIIDDILKSPSVDTVKRCYIEDKKIVDQIKLDEDIFKEYHLKLRELFDFKNNFGIFLEYFEKRFRYNLMLLSKLEVEYNDPGNRVNNLRGYLFVYNNNQPPPPAQPVAKDSFNIYTPIVPASPLLYPNGTTIVPPAFGALPMFPGLNDIVDFSWNYSQLDFIRFIKYPDFSEKIKKYRDDYLALLDLNNKFFTRIDINNFNVSYPVDAAGNIINPPTNHTSYKFIILNYFKICTMLYNMKKFTDNYSNYSFEDKIFEAFNKNNYNNPTAPKAINAIFTDIVNLAHPVGAPPAGSNKKDQISEQFHTYLIDKNLLFQDKLDSNITDSLLENTYDLKKMIKLINDRNMISYFFNFLNTKTANPIIPTIDFSNYYSNYFNVLIPSSLNGFENNKIELNKEIKYYNITEIPVFNGPILEDLIVLDRYINIFNYGVQNPTYSGTPEGQAEFILMAQDLITKLSDAEIGAYAPNINHTLNTLKASINAPGINLDKMAFINYFITTYRFRIGNIYPCDDIANSPTNYNKQKTDNYLKLFLRGNNLEAATVPFTTNPSESYFYRDGTNDIYTVDTGVCNLLRHIIIKDIKKKYDLIPKPNEIDSLLKEFNCEGLLKNEDVLEDLFKNITNKIITELINYFKHNYAKKILERVLKNISFDIELERNSAPPGLAKILNIDITKLTGIDYRYTSDFFVRLVREKYYNYNYMSNDSTSLCYKNNYHIINMLLNESITNYNIKDSEGNTILHKLIDIGNLLLFTKIYSANPSKFNRFVKIKNFNKKTPIEIIIDRIELNHNDFYNDQFTLRISERSSTFVVQQIKEIGELNMMLPNKFDMDILNTIYGIFNDIYIIFNLQNINKDIFKGLTTDYNTLFNYDKTIKWGESNVTAAGVNKIIKESYYCIILDFKYAIGEDQRYLERNPYYNRFWNTLVHVITLHLSNVYYNLMKQFLLTQNASKIGLTQNSLDKFKDAIFNYDPMFRDSYLNLAQMIVVNLYKVKYNENTNINKKLSSLTPILKLFSTKLDITEDKKEEINNHFDKIYNYVNKYFDTFKTKIELFLNNYVKFIELQYNLQAIEKFLAPKSLVVLSKKEIKKSTESLITRYTAPSFLKEKLRTIKANTPEKKFAWILYSMPSELKDEIILLYNIKDAKKIPTDVADFIDKLKPLDAQALMKGLLSKSDKTRICRTKDELCEIYEKSEEFTRYIKKLNLS